MKRLLLLLGGLTVLSWLAFCLGAWLLLTAALWILRWLT